MRISDWSSDVCSSDLWRGLQFFGLREEARVGVPTRPVAWGDRAGEKTRGPAIAAPARGRPFAARPPVDRLPSKTGAGRSRSAGETARDAGNAPPRPYPFPERPRRQVKRRQPELSAGRPQSGATELIAHLPRARTEKNT